MGLLGSGWDDPQSSANMALAAGMIQGNFGAGLLGASNSYQQAQGGALGRQLTQAQIGEIAMKNQMEQYQLKRLQDWDRLVNGDQSQTAPQTTTLGAGSGMPAIPPTAGGAMGSGTFGIPTGGQQAAAQPQPQSGFRFGLRGIPDAGSRAVAASMNPADYMKLYATQNAPQTDIEKLMAAQGIAPDSALGRQILQTAMAKANYVAPSNIRPGGYTQDMTGNVRQFPHVPDGYTAMDNGQGGFNIVPVAGGLQAVQGASAAGAMGKAEANPTVSFRGTTPVYSTQAQDVRRAQGVAPQPGVQGNFQGDPAAVAAAIAGIKDPQERANAQAAFESQMRAGNGQLTPQLPPGTALGQENAQNEVGKRWQTLVTQNQEAENTKGYLDSIKQLASKAAVGPFSDKLQFTNALLALAGNERATDATTANNLLDKYSSQIVARLGGSGGLATDSARSILQSAYPNAHMTKEAIAEAADNISGAQSMIQAKAGLLEQHANARNPAAYTKAEIQFDKNADPRLWQLKNMDAATAQKWLASQPPSVQADLRRRAGNLKLLGVL